MLENECKFHKNEENYIKSPE